MYIKNVFGYRYGFQGQEKDDEVAGAGNSNTAMFWQYDTRLGRRWNLDPVLKTNESPYVCFSNNPIRYSDILGDNGDDKVEYASGVDNSKVTEGAEKVLGDLADAAGVSKVTVTSTARDAKAQASAMYYKLAIGKPDKYRPPGTRVQQVYYDKIKAGITDKATIVDAMYDKIMEEGPSKVSSHSADFTKKVTVDLGYGSNQMTEKQETKFLAKIEEYKKSGIVLDLQYKGNNSNEQAYHIVISVPKSNELIQEAKETTTSVTPTDAAASTAGNGNNNNTTIPKEKPSKQRTVNSWGSFISELTRWTNW